ncbi:MAG: hypothetical protein ACO3QN_02880, partial [Bacilli bacterium]
DGQLQCQMAPTLPVSFFKDGQVKTRLFANTEVVMTLQNKEGQLDDKLTVIGYRLFTKTSITPTAIAGAVIQGSLAEAIRLGQFVKIEVLLKGGQTPSA